VKILLIYPKTDNLIARHVALLAEGLKQSAEVKVADNSATFRQLLRDMEPDIVHCHGCWHYFLGRACSSAIRNDARVVITPHGQLEPWIIKKQGLQQSMSKTFLWQKRTIEKAYAVILLGKLERTNFEKLDWNKRIEIIPNAIITNTISPSQMCKETFAVYQKVMDSHTIALMDDDTKRAAALIIKTGVLGDRRWLNGASLPQEINWRQLLIYAEHEHIRNYVDYGINILGLNAPMLDTKHIACYFPEEYTVPKPVKECIGDYEGDETDYLVRIIRQINKEPLILHLIELMRELYRDTVNDDQLCERLEEKKLLPFASRLMQVLSEQTGLSEGFMPLPPVDDRQTRHIRKLLSNHLKI